MAYRGNDHFQYIVKNILVLYKYIQIPLQIYLTYICIVIGDTSYKTRYTLLYWACSRLDLCFPQLFSSDKNGFVGLVHVELIYKKEKETKQKKKRISIIKGRKIKQAKKKKKLHERKTQVRS